MADSTATLRAGKRGTSLAKIQLGIPADFPLTPNQKNGQWCKKVRGKVHYFGKIADDPKGEAAANLWAEQKDDLYAGRKPRDKRDGLTIGELCDRFVQAKDALLAAGEITQRTRNNYKSTTDRIVTQFSASRIVEDLASDDFETLRSELAKTRGPVALGNEIQCVRIVFKYAFDSGLIERP